MTPEIFFAQSDSFLAISSQSPSPADSLSSVLKLPAPKLESILCCKYQLRNLTQFSAGTAISSHLTSRSSTLDSVIILAAWESRYIASGRPPQKTPFSLYCWVLIHYCMDVFTALLRSRALRGTQKTPLFYRYVTSQRTWRVSLLRVYGPLPSNGCFSASTVLALSKYSTINLAIWHYFLLMQFLIYCIFSNLLAYFPLLENKVKVKVTLQLTVGQSISLGVEPRLGLMTRYLLLFDSYGLVSVGLPLWREDWSVFCICCWPSPAQSLGPESLGSRDYILLSQFWDFPFRRLLRLAGSRWRYSNPPPHGCEKQDVLGRNNLRHFDMTRTT
jgi:hypothetical protein